MRRPTPRYRSLVPVLAGTLVAAVLGGLSCGEAPTAPRPADPVAVTLSVQGWPDEMVVGSRYAVRVLGVTTAGDTARGLPLEGAAADTTVLLVQRVAGTDSFRLQARSPGSVRATFRVAGSPLFQDATTEGSGRAVVKGIELPLGRTGAPVVITSFGDTVEVRAQGVGAAGAVAPPAVQWVIRDPMGAVGAREVHDSGTASLLVWGLSDGAVTIVASASAFCSGACTDSLQVQVAQRVASVRVSPRAVLLQSLRDSATVAIEARDRRGNLVVSAVTSGTVAPRDTAVVSPTPAGVLRARTNGSAQVWFRVGGVADTVPVTVRQAVARVTMSPRAPRAVEGARGDTLRAVLTDPAGQRLARPVTLNWRSSADSIATTVTVDSLRVVLSGGVIGNVPVVVRADSVADTVIAQVVPRRASVRIRRPGSTTITSLGDTLALRADVFDGLGVPDSLQAIVWSSLDPTVATVGPRGEVVARATGAARIVATADQGRLADTLSVLVAQTAVRLEVYPTVQLSPERTLTLRGIAYDRRGARIVGAQPAWTSGAPAVATVTGSAVTAVGAGVAMVTATLDGVSATTQVEVQSPLMLHAMSSASVTVNASATLLPGFGLWMQPSRNSTFSPCCVLTPSGGGAVSGTWTVPLDVAGEFDLVGTYYAIPFDVTAVAVRLRVRVGDDPLTLGIASGDAQRAPAGAVPAVPIVIQTQPYAFVTLRVMQGGGSIDEGLSAPRVADATGAIVITSWRLGYVAGANALRVEGSGGVQVDVTATGTSSGGVQARPGGPVPPRLGVMGGPDRQP